MRQFQIKPTKKTCGPLVARTPCKTQSLIFLPFLVSISQDATASEGILLKQWVRRALLAGGGGGVHRSQKKLKVRQKGSLSLILEMRFYFIPSTDSSQAVWARQKTVKVQLSVIKKNRAYSENATSACVRKLWASCSPHGSEAACCAPKGQACFSSYLGQQNHWHVWPWRNHSHTEHPLQPNERTNPQLVSHNQRKESSAPREKK